MASALDPAAGAARDQQRNVERRVAVAVAHAAAEENHRVVEQRTIARRGAGETLEEATEQLDLPGVDLDQTGELLRLVAMVRDVMPRLVDPEVREDQLARLAV